MPLSISNSCYQHISLKQHGKSAFD